MNKFTQWHIATCNVTDMTWGKILYGVAGYDEEII